MNEFLNPGLKYCHLVLGGERYEYCYDPETREISTQMFPKIKIDKVVVGCGKSFGHDIIRDIIEDRYGFIPVSEADSIKGNCR